jgi:hypothetical protein
MCGFHNSIYFDNIFHLYSVASTSMQPDSPDDRVPRKRRANQISEQDREEYILITGLEYYHMHRVMSSLKYRIFMTGNYSDFISIALI